MQSENSGLAASTDSNTREDPSNWTTPSHQSNMASAHSYPDFSGGADSEGESKRGTVFEQDMIEVPERPHPPLHSAASLPPLVDRGSGRHPAPPPDMDEIE